MITEAEVLAELLDFRKALEQLIIRFPRPTHISCPEILDAQATLIAVTMGSFTAQSALAHILDHDGYSCATGILESIGDAIEREARSTFEKIAPIHDIDLDRIQQAATFKRAVVLRAVRTGDLITDADLLEAMDEEEGEEDVNTTTRNAILRMIQKEEGQT